MRKNIERNVDAGFKLRDIISQEEQLVMKMAVSQKKYNLDKTQFETGKRLHRESGKPLSKAGQRLMNTLKPQTWLDQKGKVVNFARDMAGLKD